PIFSSSLPLLLLFLLPLPPPPSSTLFPYTTLFRSQCACGDNRRRCAGIQHGDIHSIRILDFDLRQQSGGRDAGMERGLPDIPASDRKSTRLNSSHVAISYAVFCLKKKKKR